MKVAILGYGIEGKVAYDYWQALGNDVTIFDDNAIKVPAGAKLQVGLDWQLGDFDLIVRSPGVRPDRIPQGIKVTSVVREFIAKCPAPIIGVTGTKGKGTTTTLITKMLEAAGKTAHLGGNIGRPALEFLDQVKTGDWVVLELSSFQLLDATQSPQIAVCLMIVPEHLNWHPDMTEYVEAKGNIFRFQKPQDTAIYNARNKYSSQIAQLSEGTKLPYLDEAGAYVKDDQIFFQDTSICKTGEVDLLGAHNLENVCAAVAAVYPLIKDAASLAKAIREFKGLEHRLEVAGLVDGITYVDDSFSTTPETTIAAINSFDQPKVLILGGSDKGSDYTEMARFITDANVRHVIAIGDMATKISRALQAADYDAITTGPTDMTQIMKAAGEVAKSGDVVLLSPACASFGLFKDYKERGNQFKQAVQALGGVA